VAILSCHPKDKKSNYSFLAFFLSKFCSTFTWKWWNGRRADVSGHFRLTATINKTLHNRINDLLNAISENTPKVLVQLLGYNSNIT